LALKEIDMSPLSIAELALWQRAGFGHTLIDVRRAAKRHSDGDQIAGSQWLDPAQWLDWKDRFEHAPAPPVVVYCAYGHEISQGLTATLRVLGADARHLDGGIDAWRKAGLAVEPLP
jgi:rhodanese-related sulfurtransferase